MRITTAVSLVLCIGMCALWVRSYRECDGLRWLNRTGGDGQDDVVVLEVYLGKGKVEFDWSKEHSYPADPQTPWRRVFHVDGPRGTAERPLKSGWRKSFAGFGVTDDWVNANNKKWFEQQIEHFKRTQTWRSGWFVWEESYRGVWVPHWFLALVFGVMPMRWVFVEMRRRRRIARGLCLGCAYDMRGGQERCPECGRTLTLPSPRVLGEGIS